MLRQWLKMWDGPTDWHRDVRTEERRQGVEFCGPLKMLWSVTRSSNAPPPKLGSGIERGSGPEKAGDLQLAWIWAWRLGLKHQRWNQSFDGGIWASRLRFEHALGLKFESRDWNLSHDTGISAYWLEFEHWGQDLILNAATVDLNPIWQISKYQHS